MAGAHVRARTLALAALLVLAGCAAPLGDGTRPLGDPLGWEDGHWYDDPVEVTPEDGYNESEQRAVVARTMARVEQVRGLEFERRVPVEVISRDEFRDRRAQSPPTRTRQSEAFQAWNDQVWEALFLVGEDRSFSGAYSEATETTVQGYYSPREGRIVVVSDSETPRLDRRTLAHELVHALQDQHFGFGPRVRTQDRQLANQGLTEGDANLVTYRYEQRCTDGEWDCLPRPERGNASRAASGEFPMGVFVAIYQPYASGPSFVETLRERGGWDAVDAAYTRFPESTEQVIHPERYPDERPVEVAVPDRSRGGWGRFDLDPVADTAGEASVYAMLQANGGLGDHPTYDYAHPASTGWGGDALVPYRDGDRYGYVWRIEWDTAGDAREFLEAYRGVLRAHGATRDGDVWVVPESEPFGDAFRVTRSGETVTIVNGPTRASLERIHPRAS